MKITSRAFDFNKDYVTIQVWWNKFSSFAPRREHLPQNGIIVEIDDTPACAGFLYKTDSKICVFEFVVSNPFIDKYSRDVALGRLIDNAKNWAETNDFSLIYSSIGIPKFISRLEEKGFMEADTGQTHMFYQVKKDE